MIGGPCIAVTALPSFDSSASERPRALLLQLTRLALMPDRQNQHDILGRGPAIFGEASPLLMILRTILPLAACDLARMLDGGTAGGVHGKFQRPRWPRGLTRLPDCLMRRFALLYMQIYMRAYS